MYVLPPYLDYVQLIGDRRQGEPKPRPPRRPSRFRRDR